jgi:hypothetical protein
MDTDETQMGETFNFQRQTVGEFMIWKPEGSDE